MIKKVRCLQRDWDPKTGLIDLLVYYEVPEGQPDEVKHKFGEYIRTNLGALQRN